MLDAYDVVVIGGGPAGSFVAGNLARQGVHVLAVEGKRFPRDHIGESLLAMSMPLLEEWGVVPKLERGGFVRKPGSIFIWGRSRKEMKLDMPRPRYAFQVARGRFDQLLLEHALEDGIELAQERWVRGLLTGPDGAVRGVRVSGPDGEREVSARFVVDASGLAQYVPRRLGFPIELSGPKRVALSGYFRGALRPDPPHANDIVTEACRDGWLWFIPLSDEITSVGFVGDEDDLDRPPEDAFEDEVATSTLVRRLIEPASVDRKVRVLRYTNHMVAAPLWGDGYVLVGDSAIFVDPLFSTGVHGALYSSSLAAAGLSSVLGGEAPEDEARVWYDRKVKSHYRRVQRMVRLLYGIHPGESRFWRNRDLSGMTDVEGEEWARKLGALGLSFFAGPVADGALELPPPLMRRLPEFRLSFRPAPVAPDDVLELAPGVELRRDWMRSRGRLVPAVVLVHASARTVPVEHPADGLRGRLLLALAEPRTAAAAALAAGGGPAAALAEATTFLGTLVEAGLLSRSREETARTPRDLALSVAG